MQHAASQRAAAAAPPRACPPSRVPPPPPTPSRRNLLASLAGVVTVAGLGMGVVAPPPARAFIDAPPAFRVHEDKLDGYYFFYPDDWLAVTVR